MLLELLEQRAGGFVKSQKTGIKQRRDFVNAQQGVKKRSADSTVGEFFCF